jgi:hypothetical protein
MITRGAMVLVAVAAPASAQDAALVARMAAVNTADPPPTVADITPELLARTQTTASAEGRCVPTAVTVDALAPATASADVQSAIAAGDVRNGWTTSAHSVGCPSALPERFLLLLQPDGAVRFVTLFRGTTLTGFAQMRDAAKAAGDAALAASQKLDPLCTKAGMGIISTEVMRKSVNLGPDFYGVRFTGSWDELWTLAACSGRAMVPITFTADGNGGASVAINAAAVKFVRP